MSPNGSLALMLISLFVSFGFPFMFLMTQDQKKQTQTGEFNFTPHTTHMLICCRIVHHYCHLEAHQLSEITQMAFALSDQSQLWKSALAAEQLILQRKIKMHFRRLDTWKQNSCWLVWLVFPSVVVKNCSFNTVCLSSTTSHNGVKI